MIGGGGVGAPGGSLRGGMGGGAPAFTPGIAVRPIAPQGGTIYRGTPHFERGPLSGYLRTPRVPGAPLTEFRHVPQLQRVPLSEFRRTPQIQRPPLVARADVLKRLGEHHPRHRHRQRGFAYFYGGWWYAYPWWAEYYPSGASCEYAQSVCAVDWGYQTENYYLCMRDYGCY